MACASGNLAHLYLTCSDGRVSREEIGVRYPELIQGLSSHPGVGLVVVHSSIDGAVALGRTGEHHLETGRIVDVDPLLPYGSLAAESLRRLAGFANSGDLVVIGPYDRESGEVVSYEDLVGSHGGLGGRQGRPFLLHPADLPIHDAPMVGAVAVHAELRRWLETLRAPTQAEPDALHPRSDTRPLGQTERSEVEPGQESIAAAT